ncbi:putative GMC oxidoreductase [Nemania abortiva]|nr:putative GMC oxidoreductase [Nemania abortiva]
MWPFSRKYPLKSAEQIAANEYDYIIVGGGTAGCAVASRLSEDSTVSVLLIEKGDLHDRWLSRIPLASVVNGSYVVRQSVKPEAATDYRQSHITAAEALGGNSRINGMIYTRSVPAYYHQWAQLGHPTWDWDAVQPYFSKVEHRRGCGASSGAVHVRSHVPTTKVYDYLKTSAEALGLCVNAELDGPASPSMGYFNLRLTIDENGYRHSAERAYLPYDLAFQRRDSLHICASTVVERLDFSQGNSIVTGVIVQPVHSKSKRDVHIRARREVILCAGAIYTPQILQLSGIGPESLLMKHSIAVRHNLPGVGGSLVDHALVPLFIDVDPHDTLHEMARSPFQALREFFSFVVCGNGWLKSSVDRAIFINTAHLNRDTMTILDGNWGLDGSRQEDIPNIEIMIVPVNTKLETYPDNTSITFQIVINQPFSTGLVRIESTDPTACPAISLGILSDHRDIEAARDGLRFSLHLTEHFTECSGYPYPSQVTNGPGVQGGAKGWRDISDADLDEYIKQNIEPAWHLTSSCRMGRQDEGGVVDDELRVHGVKNLRISDASVLPIITSAHPMATVYMVAERCADFVKGTWNGK